MMGGGLGLSLALMGIIPLLVIVVIVWLVVESTRRRDDRPVGQYQSPPQALGTATVALSATQVTFSARAVLDERYAHGEIERDDYLQRRGDVG